jgi:aspartyl-tRNA(Asn)/glutamyl-tRNA(Gln) amidotransferase subunit A
MLADYRSPYTATAAQRLIDAGAVIIGKTNLDEFAMGSSGEHSAFGPTRNPWDTSRVPGGSSAGSAAAVSAGIVPLALGSDTGGSIRQPAGLCNIVGMKPTYGRISRYGLVAFASSLDQIGPLTRSVADCAAALTVLCGFDPNDSTSADLPYPDVLDNLETPIEDLVIGVPRQARSHVNHPGVTQAIEDAARAFATLGADVIDIDLPHADHGVAAYYIIAPAEASSNLARFDGIRYGHRAVLRPGEDLSDLYSRSRAEGFGAEVQRRIMLGTHVLSSGYYDAYYTTALKVRRLIRQDYDQVFRGGCHAVLMPSSPSPAFRIGEKVGDPLSLYVEDVYTVGANLAGLPGITIPGGFAGVEGVQLPIGLQLIGQPFCEHDLLRIAAMLERATGFGQRTPPLR